MLRELYYNRVISRDKTSRRKLTNPCEKINLDFSQNDYLGLSQHPDILAQGQKAAYAYGVGATGARLLSGNRSLFETFEAEIAACKQTEGALLFNSGFQCNASVLATLLHQSTLGQQPVVFFDRLNHASLYQAVFLSGAHLVRYRHADWQHLRDLLAKTCYQERLKFIVTETLFGMDGDIAPLDRIAELARQHQALVYLDEAHATGVLGQNGYGLSTKYNWHDITTVIMGTFSKALGSSGAYIASTNDILDYILNFCPGFIYSTAPAPFCIGAARAGWHLLPDYEHQRTHLCELGDYLRTQLHLLGFNTGLSITHIVPIILNQNDISQSVTTRLLESGIKVSCIRPPVVPPGTARLRITLRIDHSPQDIDTFIKVLRCVTLNL